MGGILVLLHGCIDIKGTVLDKMHYLFYYLAPAMNPRYLSLIDAATGASVSASVRVGMAVETVGQAGRPKTITGFQVCSVLFVIPHSHHIARYDLISRMQCRHTLHPYCWGLKIAPSWLEATTHP
jgi:hypothetical protein